MIRRLSATGSGRTPLLLLAMISAAALGCGNDSTDPHVGGVASVDVSAKAELELGQADTAIATARDESGAPVAASISWSSTSPDVAVITPEGEIRAKSVGTAEIVATSADKVGRKQITVFPPPLVINEVNPDGDLNGGWIEVFNSSPRAVNVGGWFIVTLIGPNHAEIFNFPASVIGPGEFVVVDEALIPGSLKASGLVGLFSSFGVATDGLSWTANASGTAYARCPDGDRARDLVITPTPTRKAPNVCGP